MNTANTTTTNNNSVKRITAGEVAVTLADLFARDERVSSVQFLKGSEGVVLNINGKKFKITVTE
jgi:hypothetical protein